MGLKPIQLKNIEIQNEITNKIVKNNVVSGAAGLLFLMIYSKKY